MRKFFYTLVLVGLVGAGCTKTEPPYIPQEGEQGFVPAVPVGLFALDIDHESARLQWGSVAGADIYEVRLVCGDVDSLLLVDVPSLYLEGGLDQMSDYTWSVKAGTDEGLFSAASVASEFSTMLAPPTGFGTDYMFSSGVVLYWDYVAGCTYDISLDPAPFDAAMVSQRQWCATGLDIGLTYTATLVAICGEFRSHSVSLSFTTISAEDYLALP